mgnify:CR=1 FL=1
MLTDTILSLFIAFFACAALCPLMIPLLHRMKFGQQVRDDGPQSHLKKSGTPTMGGIMIVLAIALGCLPFLKKAPETLPVLLFTLAFGFIGFLDDFLKIKRKQSEGLKSWQKFVLQLLATGVLAWRLLVAARYETVLVPFTGGMETGLFLPLGSLFVPFVFFVVLGTDNGVNFTDGLDGLCSSVTVVVALFFAALACRFSPGAAPVSGAVIGALLGFLLFNCYPAKVFMGDTGSLALGGYAAAIALVLRAPLFLMVVGFIYMAEVISVILQVGYFKATKGKRLFRMAPIHHHFELGGWSETRVVTVFTIVTVILSLAAWIGLGD